MRKGFAQKKRYGALSFGVLALLICATTVFFVAQPLLKTRAADISSTYTWKPLKIGGGGFITGFVEHPTTANLIYARADVGGLYRWNSSTQQWTQLLTGSHVSNPTASDYNVESIAVSKTNDQVVYAAVGADSNGRILKSTDQGANWTDSSGQHWSINGNGDNRTGTERLQVDPNNNNVVYFGSRQQGLWVSNNAGGSWTQVSTSAVPVGDGNGGPMGVKFVIFDPTSGTINGKTKRIYAGVSGYGLYMTNDAGANWSNIYSTSNEPYSASIASDGTLYVIISGGSNTLQKYNPGSNSWTNVTPNGGALYVAVDPFDTQRIFVTPGGVSNNNIWRSTDGGGHWDALNIAISSPDIPWITNTDETNYMSSAQITFDTQVQNKLWFPQGIGIWYATNLSDSTITWNFVDKGIEEFVATDLIAPAGGKPVSAVMDRAGFYHSNPDAYPQKPILTDKFTAGTSLDYSGGTPSFVAAIGSDTRGINADLSGYSNDGGQTWTQFSGSRNYSDLFGGNIAVSATNTSNIVWLPTYNRKPYFTNDKGATWTQGSNGLSGADDIHRQIWWQQKKALDADKVSGGTFYLYSTSNGGSFYRSTDGGQNWSQRGGSNAPTSNSNDAHVFGQVHAVPGKADHVWVSVAQGGLYYTTDGGASWTKINGVQYASAFGFGKAINGASYPAVYMYGEMNNQYGIWRSADQGANWDFVSQYPLNLYDHVAVVNGDMSIEGRVYVGFGGNGFVYGDSGATPPTPTPTPTPTPGGGNIPSPWLHQDVGSVGSAGSASYSNGTFTLTGSGQDIWGNADGFHYVYQSLSGDGSITARVASEQNTDGWAKAGVMIRESLNSDSKYADMVLTPTNGSAFQRRVTTGGSSDHSGGSGSAPYYVKLTRAGSTFTGSVSSDGSNWTQVGTVSITMNQNVFIGLALTSHNNSTLNTTTFNNVSVNGGGGNTVTLTPTDDRDDWAANSGTAAYLNASQWTTSYLKFNLSSVPSSISSAKLRVYRTETGQGNLTITALRANNDSWTESTAGGSLPGVGASITSVSSNSVGYVDLDVTSFIQGERSGDGIASITFQTSVGAWSVFSSKDNGSNQPQLVITGTSSNATLAPSDDRDDWAANSGTAAYLNASQWTSSYLKFNLSSAPSSISSAKFRIYRTETGQGSLTITVLRANNDSWTESTAGGSLPGVGASITSVTSNSVGYVDLDVTNFIKGEKSGDGIASLVVQTSAGAWTVFSAKDNSSNQPQLVITG